MEGFSPDETSTLSDAFGRLEKFEKVNFDETIELSCSLGVDPKQSSQGVRGIVNLPHGSGKEVRVIVFTDNADEAKAAGNNNEARKYIKDLYTPVRDMSHTFETASGDATTTDPGDTTHLVLQRMAESKIMEEWDGLTSTEPEEIAKLIVQTREVDGQQVPIGELEHDATKRNQRSYAKVGDEPALQLRTLRDDLASIVQDSLERVGPNDVRITEFIENCRESLTTIEDQNNQTDS